MKKQFIRVFLIVVCLLGESDGGALAGKADADKAVVERANQEFEGWDSRARCDDRSGISGMAIGANERPVLVFVGGGITNSNLQIARFDKDGNEVRTTEILSGRSLEVVQLGNSVFLITVHEAPRKGRVYGVNFENGKIRHLANSTTVHCLRSLPRQRIALLLEVQPHENQIVLYELSLDTLDLVERHCLSRQEYQNDYYGIGIHMRMSADLKHIAYVAPHSGGAPSRWTTHTLKLLDLSTGNVRDLVPSVGVQIGSFSSFGSGVPPIAWLDDRRILYQDMDVTKNEDVFGHDQKMLHRFKSVHIDTMEISECMSIEIPLSLDGGSLDIDPLTGNILFRDEWIIDLNKKSLRSAILPFVVQSFPALRRTEIRSGSIVLHEGQARCVSKVSAPSGDHIAYSLRPWGDNSLFTELYMKTKSMSQPLKVTEGSYLPVRPVGWIE
jgi:hypothetical protein